MDHKAEVQVEEQDFFNPKFEELLSHDIAPPSKLKAVQASSEIFYT